MLEDIDLHTINELKAMARVYLRFGDTPKAEQLTELADQMQARVRRSAEIFNMRAYQAADEKTGA